MGHNSDKLYITQSEWNSSTSHLATRGARINAQPSKNQVLVKQPFTNCALSFTETVDPWCDPKDGSVYEITRIVPYLLKNGKSPISGHPLNPKDLFKLVLTKSTSSSVSADDTIPNTTTKNDAEKYIDPVTHKSLTVNSQLVALKTNGRVYLKQTIQKLNIDQNSWFDLVDGTPFSREDIIVIQDPLNISYKAKEDEPSRSTAAGIKQAQSLNQDDNQGGVNKSVLGGANSVLKEISQASPVPTTSKSQNPLQVPSSKSNNAPSPTPYNAAPYSANKVSASLTSTSADLVTQNLPALIDVVEFMFADIMKSSLRNKIKGKAYIQLSTTLGKLNLELHCDKAPKTCYNFITLSQQRKYTDVIFHRLLPGFMVQGGDPTGTGRGGASCWDAPFRDEYGEKGAYEHDSRGVLSMANSGPGTNGSQFFLTFRKTPHLNGKHTVFGRIVGGMEVLDAMEKTPTDPSTSKPLIPIKIADVNIFVNPFDEYKQRLKRKQLKDEESQLLQQKRKSKQLENDNDKTTWLGTQLNGDHSAQELHSDTLKPSVGKYINNNKVDPSPVAQSEANYQNKKRKNMNAYTDFSAW